MISDDMRAMQTSQSSLVTASIGVADTAFLSADANRISIIISAPSTNRCTINFEGAAVLDQGITLYPGGPPLSLNLTQHGGIVKKQCRAISPIAANQMTAALVTATLS